MTPENGWRPAARSSGSNQHDVRSGEQELLADREAELRAIRSTMEKNEAAILRAMDDQRRAWESEVVAERESWECRLRDAERQMDAVRRSLTERIRDLERENAALLSSNVEHARQHHGHSSTHPRRTASIDEQRSQRPGDEVLAGRGSFQQLSVNGVDGRLHAARNFTPGSNTSTGRTASILSEQRRPPAIELNSKSAGTDAAASRLPAIQERPMMTRCQYCEAMSSELEHVRQEFDAEKQQWLAEKRRVITYQKLLQSKYIQLEQRCAELEGSNHTDNLKHVESVNGIVPTSLALRGDWQSGLSQSPSSSLSPRLIPFGKSVET